MGRPPKKVWKSSTLDPVKITVNRGRGLGNSPIPDEENLVDDGDAMQQPLGSNVTSQGLAFQVKERFVHRLAHLSSIGATLHEDPNERAITFHLLGHLSTEQQKNAQIIERSLTHIANHNHDLDTCASSKTSLRDAIFKWYTPRLQTITYNIHTIFDVHREVFDQVQSQMFGLLEPGEKASQLDRELGDQLTALRSLVFAATRDSEESHKSLVQLAFNMCHISHLQKRLKSLLPKSALAIGLYDGICTLASPELAIGTFIRTANLPIVAIIRIVYANTSPGPNNDTLQPTAGTAGFHAPIPVPTRPYYAPEPSKRLKNFREALKPEQDPTAEFFLAARPYLSPVDQPLGFLQLQPIAKRQTFLLLAAVIRGQNPRPEWDCYHDFGYVACRDAEDMQRLGGLYSAMLTDTDRGPKPDMFQDLWQALEKNALIQHIESHGYLDSLRQTLPKLEGFLLTPRNKCASVWRLVQFIRDEGNTDTPSPELCKDYGFQHCNHSREDILILKNIYKDILLNKTDTMELQAACSRGKLVELAEKLGVWVEPRHRRLMQNTHGF